MPIYFDSTGTKRFGVGMDGGSQPLGAFRLCAKTIDTKCYDPYQKKKSRRSPSISIVHTQHVWYVCVNVCTCKRVLFIMKS